MNWIYINLKHGEKSVEVSQVAGVESTFGRSFINSKSFKQALEHCNEYAEILADKYGYHLVPFHGGVDV